MRLILTLFLSLSLIGGFAHAQQVNMDNVWPLERCVQYAIDHNITIRQDSLNARLARYTLLQSQLSMLPAVNVSGNYGHSSGRSINPTTNQFQNSAYSFLGPSASSNVLLFGWMQVHNTIQKNRYSLQAALATLDQRRNDISINVANGYLAALLADEQVNISRNQAEVTKAKLDQTRAFADAGRVPELDVAQLESQLASDSANLVGAISSYNSAILDLKTLLTLDFSEPFVVKAPNLEGSANLGLPPLRPEDIFIAARNRFSSVKANELQVKAAEKALAAAKGNRYPQLSLSYQLGTNYASNYYSYQQTTDLVGLAPIGFTSKLDTVYQPVFRTLTPTIPFSTQLENNLRQTTMLTLNIPLFNGWQTQYSVKQARINLAQRRLTEYSTELSLKQEVYKAHNNAVNAMQQYLAARRAHDAARRALDFAQKRYETGLTSTVDLLVTKNNEYTAAVNLARAKYDFVFKLKLIDFYLGKELKL